MRAVEQPHERAIGDGAGHVAQLRQPVQPQLADAREVGLAQRRPRGDVGEQRQRRCGEAAERGDGQQRGVGADVGIELRAEARQRFVNLDGRAVAAALVQHVDGDRRQPFFAERIVGGAALHEQHQRHDRDRRVTDASRRAARRQRRLLDRREAKRAGRRRAPAARLRSTLSLLMTPRRRRSRAAPARRGRAARR